MFTRILIILAISVGIIIPVYSASTVKANPVGVPYETMISFGDGYTSADELYDVSITVLEIVRSDKAWQLLHSSSPGAPPSPAGTEYLLARIKFDYKARGVPGDTPYLLRENQFKAVSELGVEYKFADSVTLRPGLNGILYAPDSLEGWIVFMVNNEDHLPLLVFNEEVVNTSHRGSGLWFQLY